MIKNIIFDIGKVLVEFDPFRVLTGMGLDEKTAHIIEKATALSPRWTELDRGVLPKEQVFNQMTKDLEAQYRRDAEEFLEKGVYDTVRSFDYSAPWLKGLKKKGFGVYLLSNYPSWLFKEHLKGTFTFIEYTDGRIVSAEEKLIKPDARIYSLLLSRYGLKAEECVFIDDRKENIEAAVKLGLKGIVFTNYEEASSKLDDIIKGNL